MVRGQGVQIFRLNIVCIGGWGEGGGVYDSKKTIVPVKAFFQPKSTAMLISPQKCTLLVLIRSASQRHF